MSERVPSVFQKTTVLPDQLTLWVGGKIFEGWEDMSFTRELNACASDFQVKMTDKWREDKEAWRVAAGQHAHIHIGKISMLEGFIDAVEASVSSNARGVTAKGRSKTCDLVDCSVTGDNQFTNLNLKEIATKVLAPFKIPLIFSADPGLPFPTTTLQTGETVFALLDRLARQRKLLIYPSPNGSLVFAKAGSKRASTQLVEGVNILSGKSSYDFSNRFSTYEAKGQNIGWMGEGKDTAAPLGSATDAGIGRYRPLVIMSEAVSDNGGTENRAAYEAALRKAQSLKVEIQTQGFYQKDGTLWDINQFVFVDCGFLGVRRWLIVKKVTYNKSGGGTTTTMELCLPDSFNFEKAKKKEDPLGWAKPLVASPPVRDK
jgi:prophage tail gpP-like protein